MITRALLSQGNRAKPCKFWYVNPVGNFTRKTAIEGENSHFRRPHSVIWWHPLTFTPFWITTPPHVLYALRTLTCCPFLVFALPLPPVVLVLQPPMCGTRSHLACATLPLPIPSVAFLKLTASSRLLAPPSCSPKCLRWVTSKMATNQNGHGLKRPQSDTKAARFYQQVRSHLVIKFLPLQHKSSPAEYVNFNIHTGDIRDQSRKLSKIAPILDVIFSSQI